VATVVEMNFAEKTYFPHKLLSQTHIQHLTPSVYFWLNGLTKTDPILTLLFFFLILRTFHNPSVPPNVLNI